MATFLQQLINGISQGSAYALIALGYTMVYGVLRLINFAHSDVYMVGAFMGYYLANSAAVQSVLGTSLVGAVLVMLGAMAICACVGLLIERFAYRPGRSPTRFVLAFSIPTNSKGMKILAREPVGRWFGSWGHPLQMLDEQDCMLFFERVLVPWDRLFFLYESPARVMPLAGPGGATTNFAGWANLERALYRFRLLTAFATMVAEAIGVIEYREVASKLGEMAANCEMLRLAIDQAFVRHDTAVAAELGRRDDEVDALRDELVADLAAQMGHEPALVAPSLAMIFVVQSLERVGDHAKNIAEYVVNVVEGIDLRHGAAG